MVYFKFSLFYISQQIRLKQVINEKKIQVKREQLEDIILICSSFTNVRPHIKTIFATFSAVKLWLQKLFMQRST